MLLVFQNQHLEYWQPSLHLHKAGKDNSKMTLRAITLAHLYSQAILKLVIQFIA